MSVALLVSLAGFLYVLIDRVAWSDDLVFANVVRDYSPLTWLSMRWDTWSSRLFSDLMIWIFSPSENRGLWIISSLIFLCGYVTILYNISLIFFKKNPSVRSRSIIFLFICLSIWIMSYTTFNDAVTWLTGSVNYFWPGVLFLGAIYTPIYILIKRGLPKPLWIIVSIIFAIIVSISHEQLGLSLVMICLSCTLIYLITRKKYKDKGTISSLPVITLGLFSILSIGLLYVMVHAPGNDTRLSIETASWMPDINSVPLSIRIESDIRWFLDRLINHSGLILLIITSTLFVLLRNNRNKILAYIMGALSILLFTARIMPGNIAVVNIKPLQYIFDFHASWGYVGSFKQWIIIAFWILSLAIISYCVYIVLKSTAERYLAISLLVASAGSLAAMWLSPTMYVSTYRVVFTCYLLLVVVSVLLLVKVSQSISFRNEKHRMI